MATFEELYHQHVQAVFRFAMSVVGKRDVAEDLTSEAFLALYRNLESIDQSREYRNVTPLGWGEQYHAKIFVSRESMRLIEARGGNRV